MQISLRSTSNKTAEGEDIILRETSTTRLLFRPMITDNDHDSNASVRGWFLFQRKSPNSLWKDYKEYDATNLKADEFFSLEIKSGEMLELMNELELYYNIHKRYGIQPGSNIYSKKDVQRENVISMFQEDSSLIDTLLDEGKSELLQKTIKWIGETENSEEIVSKLLEIQGEELDHLNNVIGLANLKKLLAMWEENAYNNDEGFWQKVLGENSWVLSQVFASPFLDFQEEAYVGGKTIENKEGKIVDFIYQNDLSREVALIEIKTPNTSLLSREYRTGIYSIHSDLTGSIVQVLGYKEQIIRDYAELVRDSEKEFKVFSPKCVVIVGKLEGLNDKQIESFEIYRKEMKNVIILTYDELFRKVQLLMDLLSESADNRKEV